MELLLPIHASQLNPLHSILWDDINGNGHGDLVPDDPLFDDQDKKMLAEPVLGEVDAPPASRMWVPVGGGYGVVLRPDRRLSLGRRLPLFLRDFRQDNLQVLRGTFGFRHRAVQV